jgi:hypothetical protein
MRRLFGLLQDPWFLIVLVVVALVWLSMERPEDPVFIRVRRVHGATCAYCRELPLVSNEPGS